MRAGCRVQSFSSWRAVWVVCSLYCPLSCARSSVLVCVRCVNLFWIVKLCLQLREAKTSVAIWTHTTYMHVQKCAHLHTCVDDDRSTRSWRLQFSLHGCRYCAGKKHDHAKRSDENRWCVSVSVSGSCACLCVHTCVCVFVHVCFVCVHAHVRVRVIILCPCLFAHVIVYEGFYYCCFVSLPSSRFP